jgi:hypothetical protein
MSPPDYGNNINAAVRALPGRRATTAVVSLATTCLLTAALSLTVSG